MLRCVGWNCCLWVLVACGEPEYNFVFVVNNTNQTLDMVAQFRESDNSGWKKGENEKGERKQSALNFQLVPGQSEAWRYLSAGERPTPLDHSFESLLITTPKCRVVLYQQDLLQAAKQEGAWTIEINPRDLRCSSQ